MFLLLRRAVVKLAEDQSKNLRSDESQRSPEYVRTPMQRVQSQQQQPTLPLWRRSERRGSSTHPLPVLPRQVCNVNAPHASPRPAGRPSAATERGAALDVSPPAPAL